MLRAKSGDHFFTNFYARRALRIAPLYFALLIFIFAIANHRLAALTFNSQKVHWQVYAFYLQNLYYRQASALGLAPLRLTGKVSYRLYLAHPIVGALIHYEVNGSGLAARAWTFFESPILSLKKYFTSYGPPKHHSSSDDLGSASWNALPGVD